MLDFSVKVTDRPAASTSDDIAALRDAGFTDRAILDIVQVTGFFNYINRIADGLDVDLEDWMPPHGR